MAHFTFVLSVDWHHLQRPEEIFASLAGDQKLTKPDPAHAYQKSCWVRNHRSWSQINTHKGLYQHASLPFSVASGPSIFNWAMDADLQGIPNTMYYLDDILVIEASDQQQLVTLSAVLERLHTYGFRVKKWKCKFLKPSVQLLYNSWVKLIRCQYIWSYGILLKHNWVYITMHT